MFKALYDFNAEEEGELTVKANDILHDCSGTDPTPEGWILVKNSKSLQVGFVPRNYIESIQSMDSIATDNPNKTFAMAHNNSEHVSVQATSQNNASSMSSKFKGLIKSHHATVKNSNIFNQTSQSIKPNESVFPVTLESTGNRGVTGAGGLSRSSSRDSLHSLGSTGGALNKQLHHSNSKQSLFSVVQTAKAVNKVTAKFSVNQIPVVPIVKVPAFASMAEKESYNEMVNSVSEYLEKLSSGQSDSYGLHMRTLDEFAGVITQNMKVGRRRSQLTIVGSTCMHCCHL